MSYVRTAEHLRQMSERNTTHGFTGTKFYARWGGMRERCHDKAKKYYYGRGIVICKRWNKFENFRDDMYLSYLEHVKEFGDDTSLDRINNNGNYSKSNCKWATQKEQQQNKRTTRFITFNGKTQCLTKWAKEVGIAPNIIWQRINRDKWSIEKALTKLTSNSAIRAS